MSRASPETNLPSLANAPWLKDPRTRWVLDALEANGFEARVVGGAVRNALLAQPVHDIDIATTAKPDAVMRIATETGLKAVPTGIDHGTVTLIAQGKPFEVTTLRRDIETDGRHAVVAFTDDWTEDARRRDFTINAIYCDKDGVLFDPADGFEDIKQQRVRFIGEADERIKEDYLRILRFFRFTAIYGQGTCDAAGLASCKKLRAGLEGLAGERIWAELKKLLVAPHASAVLQAMDQEKILKQVFKHEVRIELFKRLAEIESKNGLQPDPLRRLAALCTQDQKRAARLRYQLKLSNAESSRLSGMLASDWRDHVDDKTLDFMDRLIVYQRGPQFYRDDVILQWAHSAADANNKSWLHRLTFPGRWKAPPFPISGSDVQALGVQPGPKVGAILFQLESWWASEGFPDDPDRLKKRLVEIAKVTKS